MENKRVRWAFLAVVCLVILILLIGSLPITCRLNTRISPRNKQLESALEEKKCFYDEEGDQYVFPMFSYGCTLDETLDAMGIKTSLSDKEYYDELPSYATRWNCTPYPVLAFGEDYNFYLRFNIDKSEFVGLTTSLYSPESETEMIIPGDTIRSFDYVCEYVYNLISDFTKEYGVPTKGNIEMVYSADDVREFYTENDGEEIEFIWEKNGTAIMISTESTVHLSSTANRPRATFIRIYVGLVTPESEFEIFLNSKSRLVTFNGYEIKRTVLDWLVDTDLLDTSKHMKFNEYLSAVLQLKYVPEKNKKDNKKVECYQFEEGYYIYLNYHLAGDTNINDQEVVLDYVSFTTKDDETIFTGFRKDDSISEVLRQLQAALDA